LSIGIKAEDFGHIVKTDVIGKGRHRETGVDAADA